MLVKHEKLCHFIFPLKCRLDIERDSEQWKLMRSFRTQNINVEAELKDLPISFFILNFEYRSAINFSKRKI